MKVTFYEYPKCTTCKKAKKWLIDNNIDFDDIDITLNPPSKNEIKNFHKTSGLDIKKLFNTSGILYRELNLKEKLNTMNDEEKYELLSSNGMLIKRPLLVLENSIIPGFKEDKWQELLG